MIDALRHDFIFEEKLMFNLVGLLEQNKAAPFILKVKTPTVTLPRLKVFELKNIENQRLIYGFISGHFNWDYSRIYGYSLEF